MKKTLFVISIILILIIVIFCINKNDKFTLKNNKKQIEKNFVLKIGNPLDKGNSQIPDTKKLFVSLNLFGNELPYVRGMGKVPDLHTAIKNDKTGRLKISW